jgi:peptidoglycan/LPS O-acetylase OafA/YrhL
MQHSVETFARHGRLRDPTTYPAAPPAVNVQNPRFPYMDSLRAIAALSVFGAHAAIVLKGIGGVNLSPYLARLDVGVAIFLTLSGFLLYRPFAQARFTRAPRPALVPFAIRRTLRILPAYWLAAVVVAIMIGSHDFFLPAREVTLEGIGTYWGLLQVYSEETIIGGIGQAWTVCVEATFYMLLPLWAVLARRAPARSDREFLVSELLPLAGMFVVGVVWKIAVFEQTAAGTTKLTPGIYSLPAFFDFFAVGMALAAVHVVVTNRGREPGIVRLVGGRPWIPVTVAVVAFWLSGVVGDALGEVNNRQFMIRHQLNEVTGLGLILPVIFGDQSKGLFRRVLANRALLWLGATSYAFYLYHLAILRELERAGVPDAVGGLAYVLICFVIALAAGAASWYGLERYALRLGRRLAGGQASAGNVLERRDLQHEGPPPSVVADPRQAAS